MSAVDTAKSVAECVFDITWQAIQSGIHRLYEDSRVFFDDVYSCAMEFEAVARDYSAGPSYFEQIEDHTVAFFKRKGKL